MTLSAPSLPVRDSDASTAASSVSSSSSYSAASAGPSVAAARVLRVDREVENIGARVPLSKKRVTWRFVFAGAEQVHTVTLEHSRISAKKRLRLDGRRLFSSEEYCAGNWHYDFGVDPAASASAGDGTHGKPRDPTAPVFRVAIRDVKSTVVDQRSLDGLYELFVDGTPWERLGERALPASQRRGSSATVWSSALYARRVDDSLGELLPEMTGDRNADGTLLTWTFAFGVSGSIHKLELRDLTRGEFVVVLDCRELHRVDHDDITEDSWEFEYSLSDNHELEIVVTLVDDHKQYEFFIDGSPWADIGETDFVLQPGWYPVYSRSRNAAYFRHEATGQTQWEKPIMSRNGSLIDRPSLPHSEVSPSSQGNQEDLLLHGVGATRLSKGQSQSLSPQHSPQSQVHRQQSPKRYDTQQPQEHHVFESALLQKPPRTHLEPVLEVPEANLLDFSEVAVHASPTNNQAPASGSDTSFAAFDPFNPAHQEFVRSGSNGSLQSKSSMQQPGPHADLLF
jgi:hypothetical protein